MVERLLWEQEVVGSNPAAPISPGNESFTMRIALTGASGFIGAALARDLVAAGHEVTALVREESRRDHIETYIDRFVVGTHDDSDARTHLLDGADVIIHNSFDWSVLKSKDFAAHVQTNLNGSLDLLQASEGRPFIYMSSIAVHHHMHDRWNGVIDESHPARPGTLYGAMKVAMEAHMWAAHAERNQAVTAIRPCAVYGIDPRLRRSIGWPIIQSVRRGQDFTKLGGGKFVHVDDVAAATVACIENPKASPAVYNLVDCYARWSDWAAITADLLGAEVKIDDSSPPAPKNTFEKGAVQDDLGVQMDRGHQGIREHLAALIDLPEE